MSHSTFEQRFRGSFVSLLRWQQLEETWRQLHQSADDGWYIYALSEDPPTTPASAEQFGRFLAEIAELLRREHEHDYCGIVYVNDREQPDFVKIYDPNNLGVSCGYSLNPPLPGWTLSRIPPAEIERPVAPAANRRRWWQRLFAG